MRPDDTAPFEEISQRWRIVSNTVSDLTGPKFEPLTFRSSDERVTARQVAGKACLIVYARSFDPPLDPLLAIFMCESGFVLSNVHLRLAIKKDAHVSLFSHGLLS